MWPCKVTWQIKYIIPLLPPDLWPLNLQMVIYYDVLPPINSRNTFDIYSLVSKVRNVVTKGEVLTAIKSDGQLVKWLCEVTWQIKSIKSYLSQYHIIQYHIKWPYILTLWGACSWNRVTFWSFDLARSCGKLKPFHYWNTYGSKTW